DARTGVRVNFTDTCDAKKIIGKAVGIKGDDLIDKLWSHMTAEQILQRSMYQERNEARFELKELIESLLGLVA
ncbi:MAG TPA: OLD family endonuclease, partial [Pseudomonas sp.]|nr:OLD family endonuclease [Pseudomonas sp.]